MTSSAIPANPTPAQRAAYFVEHETAFRLGMLPTEQPHPRTRDLAGAAQRDSAEAVRLIQAVDRELLNVADRVFPSEGFKKLVLALTASLTPSTQGRVFFTGCGATGRLSILLEACWRKACQRAERPDLEDRVFSVMAGGDFALIKSVEGYEDFSDFGKHQINETAQRNGGPLNEHDTVVAITEGGETSFVIGTAWRGLDASASTFFVFNNPADVLAQHVQRSRDVIEEPRIIKLDLSETPMAVAGSTRMQATTSELLIVGAALEMAFDAALGNDVQPPTHYRDRYARMLAQLEADAAVDAIAGLATFEAELYEREERVTYLADTLLLDVMTDTTERSPTFSLPPFRKRGDTDAPASWSFVQNPAVPTDEAWQGLLGRPIRGIDWTSDDYAAMHAPAAIVNQPPKLDADTIRTFPIGDETDADTLADRKSGAAVLLLSPSDHALAESWTAEAATYAQTAALSLCDPGELPPTRIVERVQRLLIVPITLEDDGPMGLQLHLSAKLALNTLSTVSMAILGRLAGNWMVHVSCTNKKLIDRGARLIADQCGLPYEDAVDRLFQAMADLAADPQLAARTSPVAHVIAEHAEI
ncbi:MAG: sugar phosphate isomerase [Planctomycetota bacterium]